MNPQDRILVVDDEPDIVALVSYHLARAGYAVSTAATGPDALASIRQLRPSLVVLDLMLPGLSGYEVIEQLRADQELAATPVLMLTARREEADRLRGFALGADDYLTKPFSAPELVMRVGAILRRTRSAPTHGDLISVGPLTIDRSSHAVTVGGSAIELTPTEYKLLLLLAERRGRVQPRQHLLQLVWEAAPDVQTRTVDMHVQRLRGKLGDAADLIETIRGFGYRMRGDRRTPAASPASG